MISRGFVTASTGPLSWRPFRHARESGHPVKCLTRAGFTRSEEWHRKDGTQDVPRFIFPARSPLVDGDSRAQSSPQEFQDIPPFL
jgi:hypothetical protein